MQKQTSAQRITVHSAEADQCRRKLSHCLSGGDQVINENPEFDKNEIRVIYL